MDTYERANRMRHEFEFWLRACTGNELDPGLRDPLTSLLIAIALEFERMREEIAAEGRKQR